jgi:16S rRNA (guanine527-N7)-methyltransferase
MTEEQAREWVGARFGPHRLAILDQLAAIVVRENQRQNLVAPSTLSTLWVRHIVDSAQLLIWSPNRTGAWIDIGTGAGFPGLVIAALESERDCVLVEPRRLRAEYLRRAADEIGLRNVTVTQSKIERVDRPAVAISARAVASVDKIIGSSLQCADNETIWLLPKGRSANEEVATAQQKWHGLFHVEQSLTDPDSHIVIASGVRAR